MKIIKATILVGLLALTIVACSQSDQAKPTEIIAAVPEESSVTNTPLPPDFLATAEPAPTKTSAPMETPTVAPTDTPEVVASISDDCLACHSDKDRLVETSTPVEVVPSESSGVG